MIKHVKQQYAYYPRQQINWTWLTFMSCLNMIIEHFRDNNYKIPHMNKGKMELECEGNLPTILGVIDMTRQLRDSMDATIIIDEDKMTDNDNESENTIILVHDAFTSSKKR